MVQEARALLSKLPYVLEGEVQVQPGTAVAVAGVPLDEPDGLSREDLLIVGPVEAGAVGRPAERGRLG